MKVLILNNHFNAGGITSYILNLSKGLSEIGVEVITASSGGNAQDLLGVEHITIPLETKSEISPKIYFSYRKLKPQLQDVDIIHTNTRVTRALARYLSFKSGLPYISTVHGYHKPKFKNRFLPYWGKKVITVSDFVRQHLITDFKVEFDKIALIYNGIDLDWFKNFSADNQKIRTELKLGDNFLITTIARLSDIKGFQYLLQAFKIFTKEYADALLLIAGEGKEAGRIKKLIARLNLNSQVRLIGLLKDIRPLLKITDVFVHPSLIEGLGISILEALAMRKPVVATFVGGIPEIVQNNYNGILVEPRDSGVLAEALLKLRRDSNLKESLIQNTTPSVEEFGYKKMAARTYQVYQKVLRK